MKREMVKDEKAKNWLIREGFNEEGYTYIYYGSDSYSIKNQLKDAGFKFNKILMWHTPQKDNFFSEKTFPVHWSTLLSMTAWGEGMYYEGSARLIKEEIALFNPSPYLSSHFIEPVDNKIDVEAECIGYKSVETSFGVSNLITFKSGDNIISWFTSSHPNIEIGDKGELVGTFKKHETYNGVDTTYITRARLK